MSATAINQTPDAVRRLKAQDVREQIAAVPWLKPEDRACLLRAMLEMLPRWDAYLHSERLLKFAKGDMASGDLRAAGVMVLSNMLATLARNTTVALPGEDREAVIWKTTKDLHALILDNLDAMVP